MRFTSFPTGSIIATISAGVAFALIWSLSFVVTKMGLEQLSPFWLASLRLLIAAGGLFLLKGSKIFSYWRNQSRSLLPRVVLAGLLSQAIYLGMSYWALIHIPTSIVNIAVSSLPLVTLPFSFLLLREHIGPGGILAFMLSIAGVAITLSGGGDQTSSGVGDRGIAIMALVLSVAALALGNVLIKPHISLRSLLPFCAVQFLISGLVTLALALIFEADRTPDARSLFASAPLLLFLAFIGSILGTFLWFRVLCNLAANAASSFFLLTPIFGIVLGGLVFGEPMTGTKMLGVAVISLAITLRLKQSRSSIQRNDHCLKSQDA